MIGNQAVQRGIQSKNADGFASPRHSFLCEVQNFNMKKLLAVSFFICLVVGISGTLRAQIGCPDVSASPDTTLCDTSCIQLTATPVAGFETTTYNVQQIPYSPYSFTTGTQIIVNIDDRWSSVLPINFDFCFYGNTYNQCVVGSNGIVSFDLTGAGGFMPWAINAGIPSNQNPMNCIMGPFHDIDPSVSGIIRWDTLGTAPCRLFIVSFFQVAMFSCTQLQATQQIVLYETTNIIETYIANKPLCSTWNGGAAIHGIHNANGTAATVVPGRNFPSQWAVTNDAWAFLPAGAQNYNVTWFESGNPTPIGTQDTLTVCPTAPTDYVVVAEYFNCNGDTVVVSDTANISIGSPFTVTATGTDVSCFGANDGTVSATVAGASGPVSYLWTPGNYTTATVTGLGPGTYTVLVTDTVACAFTAQVTITEPPAINLTTSVVDVTCNGAATGSATANVTGGSPGYTYAWSPGGGTTPTISGLTAGNYTVIITDSAGCSDTATVTVTEPPALATSTFSTATSCAGGSDGVMWATSTGGTGTLTHVWTPGNLTGDTITGVSAGTYTVTVTDSFGCTNTATVTVTQPTAIALSVTSNDVSCSGGSDGSATVTASGGTPGYNYQWLPSGGTAATATGLSAGVYTCVVTDQNNCVDSISVAVNEPAPLSGTVSSTNETCLGFCDGTVAVIPGSGTPPYTYQWNAPGNPTTASVQNLCSGTYSVTVTDFNNCSYVDSVTVGSPAPPVATTSADTSFCEGEGGGMIMGSASGGGGAPYYYTWSCNNPPCGLSCINCPNPIANPTDTTTYYLVVTDANGCTSAPDSVVVNIIPKPLVDAGPDTAICGVPAPCVVLNPSVTMGSGIYGYNWIPGAGLNDSTILNPCARPDTSTIYALVVTDLVTGCTSDFTTTDTVSTVLVEVSPTPIADAGPDLVVCEGDSAQLQGIATGAGPAYDYQWTPAAGLSNPAIANPFAGPALTTIYSLVVESNGCPSIADTATVFVVEIPSVDAGQNRDICAGDSAFLDGAAVVANQIIPDSIVAYQWFPTNGLSDSTSEDVWASPAQTQWYYLQAFTAAGCTNIDSVLVTINPSPIVDAGDNLVICEGTGPWDLFGDIQWVNNNPPGDLQNILIEWQPQQYIIGPNDQQNVQVQPDSTTYFYFTVTFNTCSMTDSVLVALIPEVFVEASADTSVICGGDSVLIQASAGLGGANFTWTPPAGLANPNSAVTLAAPDSTTTYQVIAQEAGCIDTAEVTINVIPSPSVAFTNSFTDGCAPLDVTFTSLAEDAIFVTWDFGDGNISNEHELTYTFDSIGTYDVTLFATNSGGCTGSSQVTTITVFDSANAEFTSTPLFPVELTLPSSLVQFINQSTNAVSWAWDFGNGQQSALENPEMLFDEPGTYMVSLSVQSEQGCVSRVTHGPFIIKAPDLFIPNVFSPNEDGINDNFWVEYTGDQPYNIIIFDRWGKEVFASRNKQQRWDGTMEGKKLPEGVYYYKLRIGDRDFNGNITLVR
jgi:gliding motility-associated-like protein